METSLHRTLKALYAESEEAIEVRVGAYRIDAVCNDELIEIQFASLSSIRDKIGELVKHNSVRIVKPIVAQRRIIRQETPDGPVLSRRLSPKRGTTMNLFDELVFLTRIFPHPNLIIEVPLVHVEEWRLPPPTRSKRWRRRRAKHQVKDIVLSKIADSQSFATSDSLLELIRAKELPHPFDTSELAELLSIPRDSAQRIAYVLRNIGAVKEETKRGNALTYSLAEKPKQAKKRSPKVSPKRAA